MLTRDQTLDRANDDTQTTTTYSYNDRTTGQWTGVVQAVTTLSTTNSGGNNVPKPTSTLYDYVWYDDARQSLITYDGDTSLTQAGINNALHTSTFHYDGNGRAYLVNIADGTPRNVRFVTDAQGQVLRRTVDRGSGGPPPGTDPWTRYLSFDGMRVGEVTNDGPSGTDYAAGMNAALKAARARGTASGGNVLFQNGRVTAAADFDQAYQNVAPGSVAGAGTVWTVRDGDTLQGIAAAVWGDASLWYLIADQNGLTSASTLIAGQTLTLPAKVANVGNTSDTFRPYDPNKALGDLSPTQVKPPKQGDKGCGIAGQIIAVVIAAVIVAATKGVGTPQALAILKAAGLSQAAAATGATIASAAISATAASVGSQAFLVAVGNQDSINWKQVGISAISAGVNVGLEGVPGLSGPGFVTGAVRGATASYITQDIAVATGLQDNFSWTNVAVSAVIGGFDGQWGDQIGDFARNRIPGKLGAKVGDSLRGGASALVGATARTIITGDSFGDNLIAVLPDVIGSTIGNAIGNGLAARGSSAGRGRNDDTSGYDMEVYNFDTGETGWDMNRYIVQPEGRVGGGEGERRGDGFFGWLRDGFSVIGASINYLTGRGSPAARYGSVNEGPAAATNSSDGEQSFDLGTVWSIGLRTVKDSLSVWSRLSYTSTARGERDVSARPQASLPQRLRNYYGTVPQSWTGPAPTISQTRENLPFYAGTSVTTKPSFSLVDQLLMNTVTRDQLWSFVPRNGGEVAELTTLFFQPGALIDKALVRPVTQAIGEAFRPVFPDEIDPYANEAIQANNAEHPFFLDPNRVSTGADKRGAAANLVLTVATGRIGLPRATAFTPRAPVLTEAAERTALSQTGSGSILGSADEAYNVIRGSTTDVGSIAGNTGYKASNIQKVKDHLFMNEQLLDRYESLGIPATRGRFDSDVGIAQSWQRLEAGTHGPADLQLLRHETAEAWYMRNVSPGYNAAHNAAQRRFPAPGF